MGRWRHDARRVGSGHSVVMDGPPELEAKIMVASDGDAASRNGRLRTFRRHHYAQKVSASDFKLSS